MQKSVLARRNGLNFHQICVWVNGLRGGWYVEKVQIPALFLLKIRGTPLRRIYSRRGFWLARLSAGGAVIDQKIHIEIASYNFTLKAQKRKIEGERNSCTCAANALLGCVVCFHWLVVSPGNSGVKHNSRREISVRVEAKPSNLGCCFHILQKRKYALEFHEVSCVTKLHLWWTFELSTDRCRSF